MKPVDRFEGDEEGSSDQTQTAGERRGFADLASAEAWVAVRQPLASRAIEPNMRPPTISPTIITAVSQTTI